MDEQTLNDALQRYLNDHWDEVLAHLERLISIESYRDDTHANPEENAPFGPGPRAALDEILRIAEEMGFETHDVDGYLGYAEYGADPAASDGRQIGIIGHVDVVPAGPGWSVNPYAITRKEGYLLGRGVIDDKGPVIVALHALKFWKDQGIRFPYSVRFLFGAAEETGMEDVPYYRERYADPDFLFTPDAEFPVCYGEKGHYDGTLVSIPFTDGALVDFQGGTAPNAVPGSAFAVIRCENAAALPAANRISVTDLGDGTVRLDAEGKCQHASIPEGGINAIGLLVNYLVENELCTEQEQKFLQLEQLLFNRTDGSGMNCACADEDFGALTMVGGMIAMKDNHLEQTIDSRFPTSITVEELEANIRKASCKSHATLWRTSVQEPFLVDPQSPEIQALLNAYNSATGENAQPFTMGGGTYARMFSKAASFGPEKPWIEVPEWVGGMHGPDEGVSEELLKEAFCIYAKVLPRF